MTGIASQRDQASPTAFRIALAGIVALLYGRTVGFDFVHFDDPEYVINNPKVLAGLTMDGIGWAFSTTLMGSWNPLVWLSLMLDRELFGPTAAGFHFTNALLHLVNVQLLFATLVRMTVSVWPSAATALLLAIHPMHVESVAWISERKDVLSTMFWLLTMWTYVRYVREKHPGWYTLACTCMVLGLLAKPMLVTLPFALLLLDYWPLRRTIAWRLVIEKAPMLGASILACVLTFFAQRGQNAITDIPLGARLANAVVSYCRYLYHMVWPVDLALVYPHPSMHGGDGWPTSLVLISGVLLIAITSLVIALRRSRPSMVVGWLWLLGTMVPVIGVVQVGYQAMADRYAYVPMIGVYMAIAWLVHDQVGQRRRLRSVFISAMAIVAIALGAQCWIQIGHWRDSRALFEHSLRVMPSNWIMHQHYASVLERRGDRAAAAEHLERALCIRPNSAGVHNTLGAIRYALGDAERARTSFERALELDPNLAEAHNNLAILDQRAGHLERAEEHLRHALRINPIAGRTRKNLALLLALQGDFAQARAELATAVSADPERASEYQSAHQQIEAMQQSNVSKPSATSAPNN